MKYIKITKQVLKMAVENEWLTINPLGVFKCTYIEPERERLTMLEIMNLYNKNFLIKRLEEVRDIYVFCCFTGLAYFDVLKLSNDNIEIGIDGEKWISKNRQKTNSIERLPLLPIALAIIKKYTDNAYCINHDCILPVSSKSKI